MGKNASVYKHYDNEGRLLYVGSAIDICRRTRGHRYSSWWDRIAKITIQHFASAKEAEEAEMKAIRDEAPEHNRTANRVALLRAPRGAFDRTAYQREYMRKRRQKEKRDG